MIVFTIACLFALGIAGCSSDSDSSDGASSSGDTPATPSEDPTSGSDDPGDNPISSGTAGTLTLDGEEIALGAGRCLLEEQPAAAGGGVIELTAQAEGTNAAGEPVIVDFTRYSAESQFAGDDVSITIGDPFSGDAANPRGSADAGTVSVDGSTVSATDFEVSEDPSALQMASFTINC